MGISKEVECVKQRAIRTWDLSPPATMNRRNGNRISKVRRKQPVTRSHCTRYAFSPGISTPPLSLSTIDSCREALNRVATHPPLPTSSPCAPNRAAKIATVGQNLSTPTHHIPSPPNLTATPLQRLYCCDTLWFATCELVKTPSVSMCRSRLSRLSLNQPIMCRVD